MIRIGIIGCGTITEKRHAPEYAANPNVQLTAWFDVVAERAQSYADKYGGQIFDDWKGLIESGLCDAVSVCTPNFTHGEITVYALEHGLHVLCEKPMATSLEQCVAMAEAAEKSGKLLFIGQNQRLLPAHQMARKMITDGKIGRVLTMRTSFGHAGPESWANTKNPWFFDKQKAAFGAMFDLGIHKTDIIRYVLDDEIVEVGALGGTLDKKTSDGQPISVDDNAVAVFRTKKGVLGQLAASWTYYPRETNYARIYGTEGMLCLFEDEKEPLVFTDLNGKDIPYAIEGIQTNENQFSSGVIDAFVADIMAGGEARISGQDVCNSMRAVFAMLESMQTGRIIKIEQ